MKASDLLVKALENEGVKYIFGLPGEENLDFLDSLRQSKQIQLILTRHEQGAGFMAATLGRLTGQVGVCLSTLGPGATNFVTPAAFAQLGGMPMLMISGQKPIKRSKQGRFQIVDIVEMMSPLTKSSRQIVNAHNIPSMVREAFRVAHEERPGAVYLELPEDIARDEVEHALFAPGYVRRPTAHKKTLQATADKIMAADRPLLLIGAGANRKRTCEALNAFLEKTGIYFFNTQMGKGVVDERKKQFLGTAALSDKDYVHCAIEQADLIINVGHDVVEKPPFFMEANGREVIHINFSSAEVDDVYFPQLEVVGDIATSILKITDLVEPSSDWDFSYYERVAESIREHIHDQSEDSRFPIIPQRLVHDVRKAMPSDGIVTLDNGIYKVWFARNYLAHQPNTLLLDNALATMGAGLASAIAAKLVAPDFKVLSVNGDGGFLMNSQELETAKRLNLDLVILILRDDSYGMIKWKQTEMGFSNYGLDFDNPDFVKYAESFGAHGIRIENTEDFLPSLKTCLNSPGIHVIDVAIDYSENKRVLLDELKTKSCKL